MCPSLQKIPKLQEFVINDFPNINPQLYSSKSSSEGIQNSCFQRASAGRSRGKSPLSYNPRGCSAAMGSLWLQGPFRQAQGRAAL